MGFAHGYFRLGSSLFYLWNLKLVVGVGGDSGKLVLFNLQRIWHGESPLGFSFNTEVSLSSATVRAASPYSAEEVHLKLPVSASSEAALVTSSDGPGLSRLLCRLIRKADG